MHLRRILRHLFQIDGVFDQFEFYFIHSRPEANDELYRFGVEVIAPRNPFRAAKIVATLKPDIVHYNPLSIFSPMGVPGAKKCATIHGDGRHIEPGQSTLIRTVHARYFVPFYARKLDLVFTVSQASRELIHHKMRVSPDKILLTPNACDQRFSRMDATTSAEALIRYGIEGRFVLTVCNFSMRKNPSTLLTAFSQISRIPDLSLVIAGNGWNESLYVKRKIAELEIEGRVKLLGFVPTRDVAKLMNRAACFVFPSFAEGFGMPNLEAMACGCPVITSDAFAIPEVVGDAAILLKDKHDPAELAGRIEDVLSNEALRADLRERGLRRVTNFSWEQSARELLVGYRSLVS